MLATFWLLGLVLGPAQPPQRPTTAAPASLRGEWVIAPRLARGQELVYRGTFTEQAAGARVQFQRTYRFETRYFVLDRPSSGVDLAAMTVLQVRPADGQVPAGRNSPAAAVRLERLKLGPSGKVTAGADVSLTVPLEGAPSLEVGAFLDVPRTRQAAQQGWDVVETGRPIQAWRLAGTETVAGQVCIKLTGLQQSDDWERPRGDRGAWRRQDTLWIVPRTGLAARVQRVIEHREPARREVSQRSVLRYEFESGLTCPYRLAEDLRQEIAQALAFRDAARPLLAEPGKYARQLASLERRIAHHLESQPPTAYREAVLGVRRQVEAGGRGEVVQVGNQETQPVVHVAAVGEPAPDFIATEITGPGSARLGKWKGKAVLLVFYHPSSVTAGELLQFAQEVHTSLGRHVQVVGLSVSDDATAVLKQRTALKVSFPILHGGGLRLSYGVDSTPRLVVIDDTGVVRAAYTGWGASTAEEVRVELRRWLPGR
jgi:peroxiredoxin